jgi:broad specificity phosphatase PhoE
MRIGLARHFPVQEPWPCGWRTAAELQAWRQRYDCAAVNPIPVPDETENWARCYSSDLPRAETTARALFRGEIAALPALREAEFATFATGRLRLPVWAWRSIIRFAWFTGHASQKAPRDHFFARVRAVADLIESQRDDVLLVSHAGIMLYLSQELVRRGFRGPRFRIAEHARVYLMQR